VLVGFLDFVLPVSEAVTARGLRGWGGGMRGAVLRRALASAGFGLVVRTGWSIRDGAIALGNDR